MKTLALAVVGLVAGCAGAQAPDEDALTIPFSAVDRLPGCDAHKGTKHGSLTAVKIAGSTDLYAIFDDGKPLCIDSLAGASSNLGGVVTVQPAASNPMPGWWRSASSSNPMPGHGGGGDPAASNPMPGHGGGNDPASSNPMPGRDPLGAAPQGAPEQY